MPTLTAPALRGAPGAVPSIRAPVSDRALSVLGAVSLLGLAAFSLTFVAIAANRPSFLVPPSRSGFFALWMVGPLRGLWPGSGPSGASLGWTSSALLVAMYGLYAVACLTARRLRARWTIAAVVAVHVIFLLAPPLSYTDVFNYLGYGRMGVLHHLNPYAALPVSEPHTDPSFVLGNWHYLRSPYGPLFTLLTYALVPLGVTMSYWVLKLLVGAASLAALALIWKCAERLDRSPVSAVAFVALNPIVLIWGLGADHNDSLMMLFVAVALYLVLCRRSAASRGWQAVALTTAVAIKASAAVLLPLFLFAGPRRRFLAGAALAAAIIAAASLIAFGWHGPDLGTQSRLVTAIGIPNLIGVALGQGGETATLHAIIDAVVALAVLAAASRVFRRPDELVATCAVVLLLVVVSLSWAAPWYVSWVLPFAALAGRVRVRFAVLVLGAYFILAFMPAALMLLGDVHFRPDLTPLGVRHTREIDAIVR